MSRRSLRQPDALTLSPADADAFDALVEAGWRASALPPFLRRRAERIRALLAPLDAPATADEVDEADAASRATLVERTLARVIALPTGASMRDPADPPPALSPEEQAAVDALVANGWDPARARLELAERSEHLADIAALLEHLEGEADAKSTDVADATKDDPSLIERTLALVQEEIDRSERLRRLGAPAGALAGRAPEQPSLRMGARLWDVIGVAAAVALAASILMPILGTIRQRAMRATGAHRLADAGLGFSLFGADNFGALPAVATSVRDAPTPDAFPAGSTWWNVGQPAASHSANLFVLAGHGYTSLETLASPGNPQAPVRLDLAQHSDWRRAEEISFSYQLFPQGQPLRFADFAQPAVLLTDRSPVTARSMQGQFSQATAGSPNQRGWGLLALFSDGTVKWLQSPVLPSGDNVWLPASAEGVSPRVLLEGIERPASKKDAFVGP